MSYDELINNIMTENPSITAIAIESNGSIIYQTANWDLSADISTVVRIWSGGQGGGALNIQGIKYICLDISPERLIATNVQGQGHIVGAKGVSGNRIITYVSPDGDARGALGTLNGVASYF
ncbi:MAG: hypothetical protein ACTSRG_18275 [Candidatus Helarchaeota archaeon]